MNNTNNMLNFITLHDVAGDTIELNPAHIVYMVRTDTSKLPVTTVNNILDYDADDIITDDPIMPYTLINMAHTDMALGVIETPEEIAALQMNSMIDMMKSISKQTAVLMKEISDELDKEYGY